MSNTQRIQGIFSASEVKHGISLFSTKELGAIEDLIIEKEGRLLGTWCHQRVPLDTNHVLTSDSARQYAICYH